MYYRRTADGIEILTVWVDNLLCFASHKTLMQQLKRDLHDIFDITDLGAPTKIVGLEIDHNKENRSITISQSKYLESILQKENLSDLNPVAMPMDPHVHLNLSKGEMDNRSNNYASLIGSLMYLAVATCPDIAYAVY